MINGVELSQLQDVNFTHQNHYRRLTQVEQGQYSRISQLDNSFVKVVHNRKINHVLQSWLSKDGRNSSKQVPFIQIRSHHRSGSMQRNFSKSTLKNKAGQKHL